MSQSLIKSKDRVRDVGEVFTPDFLVEKMLDQFPEDAWELGRNWLEPTCGNGQFLLGILRRKIHKCGFTLIQALNTTFGLDIMPDNISDSHVRIYTDIVIPYFKKHKIKGRQYKRMRQRAVCIVECNIRHTEDSLKEDFNEKFELFEDMNDSMDRRIGDYIEEVLENIDNGVMKRSRLYKELSVFAKACE